MHTSKLYHICALFEKVASGIPSIWYHGSPYSGLTEMSNFTRDIMFLTDSLKIATQYTKPLIGSGRAPDNAQIAPTVYAITLNFNEDEIFDTRKPEHFDLFGKLIIASRQDDPDDWLSKRDLARTLSASGKLDGDFPSFGITRRLLQLLKPFGFKAALISEGTQGVSLAVSNPQTNLAIQKEIEL